MDSHPFKLVRRHNESTVEIAGFRSMSLAMAAMNLFNAHHMKTYGRAFITDGLEDSDARYYG